MKKLLLLLTLFLANCQLSPSGDKVELDTDSDTQARYKAQWLQNTVSITKENYYNSYFDWYGGGAFSYPVYFEDGSLRTFWEESSWEGTVYPAGDGEFYNLLSNEGDYEIDLFIDGSTAIVYLPSSATTSDSMVGTLYVLQFKDDKLYRTRSADGFSHINIWDGVTVSTNDLVEVTTQPKS